MAEPRGSKVFNDTGPRGAMHNSGKTAADLDAARRRNIAYEYLCHLEEARKWMEACLKEELPSASELEEALRNGVILAKLAIFFHPEGLKEKNVYDYDQEIFKERKLVFRHTDNSAQWLRCMREMKFPEIFYPEVTDIYDKKNMPRVIYCLHALSRYLYHLGIAPEMEDLHGVAEFTEEEISAMDSELAKAGVQMPKFGKIGGILAKEIGADAAAMHAAILAINQALEQEAPADELLKRMNNLAAGLENIDSSTKTQYRENLIAARKEKEAAAPPPQEGVEQDVYDKNLTKSEIQKNVNKINATVAAERKEAALQAALKEINAAVDETDVPRLTKAMDDEGADLNEVNLNRVDKYMEALKEAKAAQGGAALTQPMVQDAVDDTNSVFAAVEAISAALEDDDADATLAALKANQQVLKLPELGSDAHRYHSDLQKADSEQELTPERIRQVVVASNSSMEHEAAELAALGTLNSCIDAGDAEATLKALKAEALGLTDVDDAGAFQYQFVLAEAKGQLPAGAMLTKPQVQQQVTAANKAAEENAKHAAALFAINEAVRSGKSASTLQALQEPNARVTGVEPRCQERYQTQLGQQLAAKASETGQTKSKWKKFTTDEGKVYYYNKETKATQWVPPADMSEPQLTLPEIQASVEGCNAEQARWDAFVAKEDKIVELQALVRGLLARKKFQDRLGYMKDNEDAIRKIQAAARGHAQRKKYKERLDYLNQQGDAAVKIQAMWKGHKVRSQYKNLTKVTAPPVATVRKFLHLLDQSEYDFREELQLQQRKEEVIKEIKRNKKLEHDLNDMDIKIGLLVKNRIELQDVVKKSKLLKKQRHRGDGSNTSLGLEKHAGLKALTKDSRERLEAYQHLFYLLQTQPAYLATLVFIEQPLERWSAHKAQTFLQRVIQTVYNYASNAREQYLLLKLFRTAMRKEVEEKVDQVREFITGNPTVIKLVINHHRGSAAGSYLADTIGPLVKELLLQEELDLNANPIDVYRKWVSQQETETGEKSSLPYDVEREEALKHEPVKKQVDETMGRLLELVSKFQDAIISNLEKLPYGLRYISMCLKQDLEQKFASVPEDDIIKVLGNFLYYRYMNPAIIAPEAFDVIEVSMSHHVTNVQRRNLASIARVLQLAASGQKFDEELQHMSPLNAFLTDAWNKFRKYFVEASSVVSSEEKYNIDEYSDVTMVSKPVIYISPEEIHYTHELLVKNLEVVAPVEEDPLREIIKDLGELQDEDDALGAEGTPDRAVSKTEMSLSLNNKFEVPVEDDGSTKALFVRTKRLIIDVIRFQQGKNLKEILETPATDEEEKAHTVYVKAKITQESKLQTTEGADDDLVRRLASVSVARKDDGGIMKLAEVKKQILENAVELEKEGLCTKDNNYQDLLNAIAQDIRNQRIYRRQRKQELAKLKDTLTDLKSKEEFFMDQIDKYDQYVTACMEQTAKGKGKKTGFFSRMKKKDTKAAGTDGYNFGSYKYNAHKLKDKGVLVHAEGVSDTQLKFVSIEISSQEVGVFTLDATAPGERKTDELLFQDLLQMQYEGQPTMKIFGFVTVNVNLLIFLINKKFYGK